MPTEQSMKSRSGQSTSWPSISATRARTMLARGEAVEDKLDKLSGENVGSTLLRTAGLANGGGTSTSGAEIGESVSPELLTTKRLSSLPRPPTVLSGMGWSSPKIQTAPSAPLTYPFAFPEASRNRVRAEMLEADRDFADRERSRVQTYAERRALAIGWICRILGVFAEEACNLARKGAPEWSLSRIEPRVSEVLRQLAFRAERSKFVGGDKPDLTNGQGDVRAEVHAEIGRSSEWSTHQNELLDLMSAFAPSRADEPLLGSPGQPPEYPNDAKPQEQNNGSIERDSVVECRKNLLAEYKLATGNPASKKIYEARNSGIHKPQFYAWLKGELSSESATAINFERFLRDKKLPLSKRPQD